MLNVSKKTLKKLQNIFGFIGFCSGIVGFFAKFSLTEKGYGKYIDITYYLNHIEYKINFPNIYWFSSFTLLACIILVLLFEIFDRIFSSPT